MLIGFDRTLGAWNMTWIFCPASRAGNARCDNDSQNSIPLTGKTFRHGLSTMFYSHIAAISTIRVSSMSRIRLSDLGLSPSCSLSPASSQVSRFSQSFHKALEDS
jgi:hypothetical protein